MKFIAKINDVASMESITRIMGTVAKLSKVCTLRLNSDKVAFSSTATMRDHAYKLWTEIVPNRFFDSYRIQGLSDDADEIVLDCVAEELFRAFKSSTQSPGRHVTIRLTKQGKQAFLTIEIQLASMGASTLDNIAIGGRTVTHNVPVSLVPQRHWGEYSEPEVPDFDVSFHLPHIKNLQKITSGMKNIANHVVVSANHTGLLSLKGETDSVSIRTHFRDITYPVWDISTSNASQRQSAAAAEDPNRLYSVRVDLKSLCTYLVALQTNFYNDARLVCNIVAQRQLHFFMQNEEYTFHYFLPAIAY